MTPGRWPYAALAPDGVGDMIANALGPWIDAGYSSPPSHRGFGDTLDDQLLLKLTRNSRVPSSAIETMNPPILGATMP